VTVMTNKPEEKAALHTELKRTLVVEHSLSVIQLKIVAAWECLVWISWGLLGGEQTGVPCPHRNANPCRCQKASS